MNGDNLLPLTKETPAVSVNPPWRLIGVFWLSRPTILHCCPQFPWLRKSCEKSPNPC